MPSQSQGVLESDLFLVMNRFIVILAVRASLVTVTHFGELAEQENALAPSSDAVID